MTHIRFLAPLAFVASMLTLALPAAADDPFGGPPGKASGDGLTTWGAIYIGGTLDNKCDGRYKNPDTFSSQTGVVASKESDCYLNNWSPTLTIPAMSSRWFKFDTVKSRDVEVYVDDVPRWGAAYNYFSPTCNRANRDCVDNLERIGIDTSEIGKQSIAMQNVQSNPQDRHMVGNGFAARVYGTDSINQNDYFWPTPNNALLTTRNGWRPSVGDTQGNWGGYNQGAIDIGSMGPGIWLDPGGTAKWGDGNTHLLVGKYHLDGWVYIQVINNMIWDNGMQISTRYTPNGNYDFPCANCPYPFNP
jgi:hypothetical protein